MAKGFAYFLHIGDTPRFPVGRKPTLIICSPARQFPTGAIMPMTRRMELVAFAKRTGAYLLEDNFESEFNYEAPPTSSLFELAPECVLSVGTFSKVLFPSVRLGYIVAPRQLVASLCTQKRLSDHHTNSLDQLALAAFLRDGELERHTRRMKKEYRARRDDLTDCLRAQFGPVVHISGGAAGMNLVAAFDGVDCMDVLVRRMLQQGAYAVPVEQQAAVKGQHKNELMLRYSGLTRDELALGAAQDALADAKIDAGELDLILVSTCTPDTNTPNTAAPLPTTSPPYSWRNAAGFVRCRCSASAQNRSPSIARGRSR